MKFEYKNHLHKEELHIEDQKKVLMVTTCNTLLLKEPILGHQKLFVFLFGQADDLKIVSQYLSGNSQPQHERFVFSPIQAIEI